MTFPEVARVFGKAGRASTSTDPAPFTMMETTVLLKPVSEWRAKPRWYSSWAPTWLVPVLRPLRPDRISDAELEDQMNRALRLPGISNAWTMPIKGRLDLLSTGIRTPVGIKIVGSDLLAVAAAPAPGNRRGRRFSRRRARGAVSRSRVGDLSTCYR